MNMNGVDTEPSRNLGINSKHDIRGQHHVDEQLNHASQSNGNDPKSIKDQGIGQKYSKNSSNVNSYTPWPPNPHSMPIPNGNQQNNNYGSLPSSSSVKNERSLRLEKKYGRNGMNNSKQPPRSMKTSSLHRSNSSLDLDRAEEVLGSVIHREYGSASSIDIISNNKDSFFSMLHDFCNYNADQRSPGPAKIRDYLRGKLDHTPSSENASNTLANGVASLDDISSPKLKSRLQKFLEMKEKGKFKTKMLHNEPSIFRKLSRSSNNKHLPDDSVKEHVDGVSFSSETRSNNKLRRKAIIHYDCQSITSHLDGANIQHILSRRRNTTTGASAASSAQRSMEDISSENSDFGDDRYNDLIQACPFFRNELGGEGERTMCLTKFTAHQKEKNAEHYSILYKASMARGISVLENSSWFGQTCPHQRTAMIIENVDDGANYYREFFQGQEHQNWFGISDNLGPVAVSIKREKLSDDASSSTNSKSKSTAVYMYRVIIRTSELAVLRGSVLEDSIPSVMRQSSRGIQPKEILDFIAPELKQDCLRLGISETSTEEELVKLDQQSLTNCHKVGIMYCKAGQSTEEEMYNNEHSGPAFNEFLEMLGRRVRLKGFDKYRAGLDVKSDSTGIYSVYASYQSCEVMFHVSTMLPYTQNNRQQLLRKSRIGNDIVTIVFQEPGALPFTPKNIRSHFQHVFIIIKVVNPCSDNTHYRIAVSRSKDVPVFGPPIPTDATFPKSKNFSEFLLAKVINAENAAYRSTKFVTMATKTRQGYLKDLASHHVTSTTIETAPKFYALHFGGSKKKERSTPRIVLDSTVKGAIAWQILVEDFSLGVTLHGYIGISVDTIVVIEERTGDRVFACASTSVMGWTTQSDVLRIYHHQGECLVIRSNDPDDIKEIVLRLSAVTQGCEVSKFSALIKFFSLCQRTYSAIDCK
ncbi:Signal-induced proliferation-associated 1-like protein 1 [Nymphon striatum]|nr:Signal-induced proliferation-associated 1-like protein 1 [Nymphon striatum]